VTVLLQGVVGSVAYGLAHEGSDVDRLGIFAASFRELHGLARLNESRVTRDPDQTLHEAAKALRLILSCNPTASEILWLPEYEVLHPLGRELIAIRGSLLSEKAVRNAYLGYATQQFRKLKLKGHFGADVPRSRIEKHARHIVRLCQQAVALHEEGYLMIRLPNAEAIRDFGAAIAADPREADDLIRRTEYRLSLPGVLPERPDRDAAEQWLLEVRRCAYRWEEH
jgi:predicted nucleotidyltransferase